MAKITFNEEDKIQWEEWAPSLQDRLIAIYNKIKQGTAYLYHYMSATRVTIGDTQPSDPIPYAEIWWDTRFEVLRVLTDEGWVMTRATWYDKANGDITNDVDSPISTNPRTNCHCYIISWQKANYCHCKSAPSTATSVTVNKQTSLAFNYEINADATKYWRWVITSSAQANLEKIVFCILNAVDKDSPGTNAIIPLSGSGNSRISLSEYENDYVSYDAEYSSLFSTDYNETYSFIQGKTYYIPFTFGLPKTIISIYGTLAAFSSGPVTVTLEASYNNGASWNVVKSITLRGNYQAAILCHQHCHCRRW